MYVLVSFCNLRSPGMPALGLLNTESFDLQVVALPDVVGTSTGVTGLAICEQYVYVTLQSLDTLTANSSTGSSVLLVLDRTHLSLVSSYVFRTGSDVHSVVSKGGLIYAVSTGTDEVLELRLEHGVVQSESCIWRPNPDGPREDKHHLNAIYVAGDELLVSGFGTKPTERWASARNGFIKNISRGELLAEGLDQPHSLLIHSGLMICCESRKMAVRHVNDPRIQYLPGYTRGMCALGDSLLVGTSVGRSVSKSSGLINNPADGGMQGGACTISRLSMDSFHVQQTVDLGTYAQEIYDLLPVDDVAQWPVIPASRWQERSIRSLLATLDTRTTWAKQSAAAAAERENTVEQLRAEIAAISAAPQSSRENLNEMRRSIDSIAERCTTFERAANALTELTQSQAERLNTLEHALEDLQLQITSRNEEIMRELAQVQSGLTGLASSLPDEASSYKRLIAAIRKDVARNTPRGANIVVVSKGDERLLQLPGRKARHFPQTLSGEYAGVYPSGTVSAIAQIEAQRLQGAHYLLFPNTAFWWLDHYAGLRDYLERRYRLGLKSESCQIFDLRDPRTDLSCDAEGIIRQVAEEFSQRHGNPAAILNCASDRPLGGKLADLSVFTPPGDGNAFPYLDRSIDVVVTSEGSPLLDEALRVAAGVLITLPSQPGGAETNEGASVKWITEPQHEHSNSISIIVTGRATAAEIDHRIQYLRGTLARAIDVEILNAVTSGDTEGKHSPVTGHAYAVACNAMAGQAKGNVLIFLDSSAAPLEGWIPAVLKTLRDHPDCGAVGAKIIACDGRIDQAGGKVIADGTLLRFGEGDYSIEDPLYAFLRPIDYAGGLLLATRRELFDRLGGFDTRFNSPSYANADYCFAARSAGCMTYYQPEVNIVCIPTAINAAPSSAEDTTADKAAFHTKWNERLERHPVRRLWYDRDAWHGEAFATELLEVAR